ncbi:MAG: glutamine-hydrolyzing GMP synthase [Spirochaetia bacterium]
MEKVVIFDFGSQTAQLIGRRIRDLGVYSEILPPDISANDFPKEDTIGIIFSGSPWSVYHDGAPTVDPYVYGLGLPILGICYGMHRMMTDFSGKIAHLGKKEFGRSLVKIDSHIPLFRHFPQDFVSWMSHGDSLQLLGEGFSIAAQSEHGFPAAVWNQDKQFYGIQFHPEVSHCEYGTELLKNFCFQICNAHGGWTMDNYIEEESERIRDKAGNEDVLLLISGGVDSTVAGGLLLQALAAEQIHLMYIDTGLMRKNESVEVEKNLKALGAKNLYIIDASEVFLSRLSGVTDPEEKRRIIGDLFIEVQQNEIEKRGVKEAILGQGTLYTDLIESGKGVGKNAHVIKSHHNVRSPLVEKKRDEGRIIEPLDKLYKDEVRELGRTLGISSSVVDRHPFPGPGLAVRIIGAVTSENCRVLREADAIFISELRKRELYDKIWQAFCVLLPIRSVGVTGDSRQYGSVVVLRAVTSADGMTADVYSFAMQELLEISAIITNSIPEVGRVVYDISSKPPATIEWE